MSLQLQRPSAPVALVVVAKAVVQAKQVIVAKLLWRVISCPVEVVKIKVHPADVLVQIT